MTPEQQKAVAERADEELRARSEIMGTHPSAATESAAATTARPTLSQRLLNVASGGCACGGRFKWTGVQMRCERCDRHEGYAIKDDVADLLREAAKVVKRHA